MNFEIVHTTEYEYSELATESFSELRVRPRNTMRQVVLTHLTEVNPRVALESFQDYYGNWVETLSVPSVTRNLLWPPRLGYKRAPLLISSRDSIFP